MSERLRAQIEEYAQAKRDFDLHRLDDDAGWTARHRRLQAAEQWLIAWVDQVAESELKLREAVCILCFKPLASHHPDGTGFAPRCYVGDQGVARFVTKKSE